MGILFIILSNYFRILTPQITGYVVNSVESELRDNISASARQSGTGAANAGTGAANTATAAAKPQTPNDTTNYDIAVRKFIRILDNGHASFSRKVVICGITLLVLALISGG